MRTTHFRAALLLLPFSIVTAHSAPIQNLTFTEVIKDVFVIDPATKAETPAKSGDKLVPPNVLKTGADSRAELIAEDKTVTRVGSNTIFSVEANSRDVNLAQGSVLFHSPAGRGGGRIKSAGATASVLGTTLAVSANSDGGFKTSLLEGKGEVKDPKGGKVGLVAGQVTFAKPGGGLSPALNFDLKAQISNSKLVGGFATPLASIAKIEAAVAVQQAKIAGGGLVSTGMLIGDRPDTAFKVDPAILDGLIRKLTETRRIAQEKPNPPTKTFYEVDPRYLARVVKTIKDSLDDEILSSLILPQRLTGGGIDQTAPDTNVFIIDRTGRGLLDDPKYPSGAIGGLPSNLPGNRDPIITYHALIANEISLKLNPQELRTLQNVNINTDPQTQRVLLTLASGQLPEWLKAGAVITGKDVLPGTFVSSINQGVAILNQSPLNSVTGGQITTAQPAQFFLPIPLIEKVGGAIVARQNLDFAGAIDFIGVDNIETTPDGYEIGQTLLLSAGKTIKIAPGSMLRANTSLFEIYAGGTSFSGDLSLSLLPLNANETPVPLALDGVAIINNFPLDSTSRSNGTIRITAPEISLNDTFITAASESSEIAIHSAGAISIATSSGSPTANHSNSPSSGSLLEPCINAFKVEINSESKTVSLDGVSLYGNEITLRSGDELKLNSALFYPFDFKREQNLTLSARNNVMIDSGATLGADRSLLNAASVNTWIASDNADIIIKNTEFGSKPLLSDPSTESRTIFTANAPDGSILLTKSAINADSVFFNAKSVTLDGVNIAPTDSDSVSVKLASSPAPNSPELLASHASTIIASGTVNITAPQIQLTNNFIFSQGSIQSSEIAIGSTGIIGIAASSPVPTSPISEDATSKLLVNLGFSNVKELGLRAFKVGIRSESKTVSLTGISLFANEITLRGGDELRLSSVLIDPFDFQREQSIIASSVNNIAIDFGAMLGESRSMIALAPAAFSTKIYSDNADILVRNAEFGTTLLESSNDQIQTQFPAPSTKFNADALNGNILLTASAINADTVIFNGKTVTFEGVNVAPTDSDKGTVAINSNSDLSVTKGKTPLANSFKAYKITLDSKNDMKLEDLLVDHVTRSHANEFRATAANELSMSRVSLSYAQNVALEASTVILGDVSFKAGSYVSIKSNAGVLSTPADLTGITKGWVNVLPRVMYGPHDLHELKSQMTNPNIPRTTGTSVSNGASVGVPGANLGAAVKAQFGVDLPNLTIGKR